MMRMDIGKILHRLTLVLFGALFLVLPLVFTSVNDELFEFNKMLFVYGIALLIAAVYVARCVLEKTFLWRRTPLDWPLLAFVVSQSISTIFSLNLRTSLFGYYTRFNGGLFSVFTYVFLYYMFVILIPKREIKKLLSMLLAGAVIASLYAFPEHFGHSPSCYLFTGKFDVSCWIQDVKSRVFGTFGQPNWLAAYLGMLLPLAVVGILQKPKEKASLLEETDHRHWLIMGAKLLAVTLFMSVLLFTKSRSGIGAVLVGFAFLFVLIGGITLKAKTSFRYPALFAAALIGFFIFMVATGSPFTEKLSQYLPHFTAKTVSTPAPSTAAVTGGTQLELGGSESGAIRSVVWKGALAVWRRYPLFGSGVETFAYSYYKDRPKEHNLLSEWDFLYNKAHNEFLNYLATTGFVGFGTYLVMLGTMTLLPLYYGYQLLRREDREANAKSQKLYDVYILCSLSAGIIILSISNFFGFSTVVVSLLMFLFPAFALKIYEAETKRADLFDPHRAITLDKVTFDQWTIIGVSLLLVIVPLLYIHRLWTADVAYAKGKTFDSLNNYQGAYPYLKQAVDALPGEPVYHDELSSNLASLAVAFAQAKDATSSAQAAQLALQESDKTLSLNSVHTNFYKTRIKVFLLLAQLKPEFYQNATNTILLARELSPTDPKLVYFLALLAQQRGATDSYVQYLKEDIDLKANDEAARQALAEYYVSQKQNYKAAEQYQYILQRINPNNQTAKSALASMSGKLKK